MNRFKDSIEGQKGPCSARKFFKNGQETPFTEDERLCLEYVESLAEGDLRPIVFENFTPENSDISENPEDGAAGAENTGRMVNLPGKYSQNIDYERERQQ